MRAGRLAAAGAVAAMLGLAALVATSVVDAERRGRRALDRLQRQQVQQLAASMDARIEGVFTTLTGIASFPYELVPGSRADQQLLEGFQRQQPDVQSGFLLLDAARRITAGTLLRDPSVIGTRLDRPGLVEALRAGRPAILPAAPGLTTSRLTAGLFAPLFDPAGGVRGALVFEAEVSPTSSFNEEVAALAGREGAEFLIIDQRGTVIAASDPALLGRRLDDRRLAAAPSGLHRRNGQVQVVADVPAAGWRVIFRQDAGAFEGGLGRRARSAVLLVVLAGLLAAGAAGAALLARLRDAREQARRLAEIASERERYVSIVSHELRIPIVGVLGFLEAALEDWNALDDEARRAAVERAAVNARRLHALASDALDADQAVAGRLDYVFGRVDLADELRAAVAAARDGHPPLVVELSGADEPVWVTADVHRLRRVLFNLLDNARRVSPPDRPVEVVLGTGDDEVTVAVTDHGPGLAPREAERIFEPFTQGRHRGSGLGLFLVRQIVTAHGGRIWATSPAGGGVTFTFTLPRTARPTDRVTSPA